jgi:uncharacterized membrane protein YphA (DoxX/SURF4 family)
MHEVHTAILLIRLSIGLTMACFGLSQLINPKGWLGYIPEWLEVLMPMKPTSFMREHALGNFFLGLLFVIGVWPVVVAWIVAAWWLSILPFALRYDRYIGLRDISIICATLADIALHYAH